MEPENRPLFSKISTLEIEKNQVLAAQFQETNLYPLVN